MAPTSLLTINDWKEEKTNVQTSKPYLIGYFTTDWKQRELSEDIHALKYFDNEMDLNIDNFQLKFNRNKIIKPSNIWTEPIIPLTNWIRKNVQNDFINNAEFITFKNVLCDIMNTPFQTNCNKNTWEITATVKYNHIFLCSKSDNYEMESLLKEKELLKRHLFVKKPEHLHRNIISVLDKLFYEIYHLNVGNNDIIYTADLPGVQDDQVITNLDALRSADHIEFDIIKTDKSALEIIYNPLWWSMAILINAKKFIIGFTSEDNNLFEIKNLLIDKLSEFQKTEKQWSPKSSWNFLDNFLNFVKLEIDRVPDKYKEKYRWTFKSFENNENLVTCEPFIETEIDGEFQYMSVLN